MGEGHHQGVEGTGPDGACRCTHGVHGWLREGLTANNPDPQDTEDRLAHLLLLATDLVAGESRAALHRRITQLEEQLAEMLH